MRANRNWDWAGKCVATVLAAATLNAAWVAPALAQKGGAKPTVKSDAGAEKRAEARAAYGAAEALFTSGDFLAAYAKYKEANDLIPAPQTLWKMAVCLDKGGKQTEAADAYAAFLASTPPESMADRVVEAKARIVALQNGAQVRLKVSSDPAGAKVMVDGKAAERPTPSDVLVAPGKHHVRLELSGYEAADKDVDVALGVPAELRITLRKGAGVTAVAVVPTTPPPVASTTPTEPAPPKQPPPAAASTAKPTNTLPWVLIGAAGAGAAIGATFGVMALSAKSQFKSDPTSDHADKAERDALIADISFGVALTLGVTGFVLMTTRSGGENARVDATPQKNAWQFAPTVGAHGGGAAAWVSF